MVDPKLLKSIKQYWDQGVKRNTIRNSLIQSGWSEKDVDKALDKATGKKAEEIKKEPEIISDKVSFDKKKIFFIIIAVIVTLVLAVFLYSSLFKLGFSEDIPEGFVGLGKIESVILYKMEFYNSLAINAASPLKEAIQNGRVNLIMTDNKGKKILDALGITVENSQIIPEFVTKVEDPSFDVKFTEAMFYSMIGDPPDRDQRFLEGYDKGKIKIKAYGKENKEKLRLLNDFAQYFFV